jgi:arylsulfatase A-like enzyme
MGVEAMLRRFSPGTGSPVRQRLRSWLLPLALCLCLACGEEAHRLNLVIIGVDTLRPDHLGCYGYRHDTSPNIDEFADRGVLFENCVAPSPWTLPSFASVFTSLYPTQHGANAQRSALRANVTTLASALKAEGYATGAIINAPFLKGLYEVDRGFDFYFMTPPEGRAADGTTRDALEWIDANRGGPFFMFAHYFDPHIPYDPPEPYDTMFYPDYRGTIRSPYNPKNLSIYRRKDFVQMESLSDADWDRVRSIYDGEIAFTDVAVGALLEGLRERHLTENTLIVFLSDHGEEFFEHHGFEHGHTLYDELIRVPLVFSLPGVLREGERVSQQVRLVDVAPTVLDMLDIPAWPASEGVSLLSLMSGAGNRPSNGTCLLPAEIALAEALLYGDDRISLSAYPWKLIYRLKGEDRISFFNLAQDPAETLDLSGESLESLALLEQTLYRTMLSIDDTWFLEIFGGDEPHTFDIHVTSEAVRGAGHFKFHRLIDSQGNILRTDALGETEITPSVIEISNLKVDEPLTLAFKLMKPKAPVSFDLKINGSPAIHDTYIGESLTRPFTMPFIEKRPLPDSDDTNLNEPDRRPEGPYFIVWLYRSRYEEEAAIELDPGTERELRSLGYIQ